MILTFRFCNVPNYLRVQIFVAACINLCEIINGYGVAWSAPVLPKFDDPAQSPLPIPISEIQKSWIATSMFFGCVGAFFGGYLANLIGRKMVLIIGGVIHILSYILLSFASNIPMLYAARIMVGGSICFLMSVEFMYVGEIASANIRGIIMTSMGVAHATGSLFVYSVGPFVSFQAVGYICIALNVLYIALCCFLPESPMYYVLKDDETLARSALERIRNDTNRELKTMMEKAREQTSNKHIWKELFKLKSNRKSLRITVILSMFQQGCGIMAVIFFANTIFRLAGSSIQPDIATIIVGATFVIGAFVAPLFIDKYGRRILLKISTAGLCAVMISLGTYFYLKQTQPSSVEKVGWLPLLLLVLAQFFHSFGLSVVPNTLAGELFTVRVRGLGPPICIYVVG